MSFDPTERHLEEVIKEFPFQEVRISGVGNSEIIIQNFPDTDKNNSPVFLPKIVGNQTDDDVVRSALIKAGAKIEAVKITDTQRNRLVTCIKDYGSSLIEATQLAFNRPDFDLGQIPKPMREYGNSSTLSIIGEPGSGKSMILAALVLKYDERVSGSLDTYSRFSVSAKLKAFRRYGLDKDSSAKEIVEAVLKLGPDIGNIETGFEPKNQSLLSIFDRFLEDRKLGRDEILVTEGLSSPFGGGISVNALHLASFQSSEGILRLNTGGEFMAGEWFEPIAMEKGYFMEKDMLQSRPTYGLSWMPYLSVDKDRGIGMDAEVLEYFLHEYKAQKQEIVDTNRAFKKQIVANIY